MLTSFFADHFDFGVADAVFCREVLLTVSADRLSHIRKGNYLIY